MTTAILPVSMRDRNSHAPQTPDRSLEQRMDALARANGIRTRRAHLKRDIKTRRVDARALILAPPAYIDTMRLWDLLLAVPKYGRVKVTRALVHCRISQSKTIGGLTDRQRHEIASWL